MSITYSSAVPNVWVKFSHNGHTDVIYHAKYEITGTKSGRTFTSSEGLDLDISSIDSFVTYDSVTESMVISWVENQHSTKVQEIKSDIEAYLDELITPTKEMRTLT